MTWNAALAAASAFEGLGVGWLEEPLFLEDVDGHAQLKARTGVPVALGENLHTRFAFESFMARDAVDVLQPDVARAGGVSEVRAIAADAARRGLPLSLHTYGDGVALAASLHLAAALDVMAVMEFEYNENPLRSRLLRERLEPDNGFLRPPDAPGLGVALDPEAVEDYRFDGEADLAQWERPLRGAGDDEARLSRG